MKLAIIVVADEKAMFHIHEADCPDIQHRSKYERASIHFIDAYDTPSDLIHAEIAAYDAQGQDFTPDDFKVFDCCLASC